MTDLTEKKVESRQLRITNLSIIAFIFSFSPAIMMFLRVAIVTISIELYNSLSTFLGALMFITLFLAILFSIIDLFGRDRRKVLSIIALIVSCTFTILMISAFALIISGTQLRQ